MASPGESGSESESESESESDPQSDLGATTGQPSSALKGGTGASQPVAAPATSRPSSKRARKGGDAGRGAGPSAVVHIGEDLVVTESERLDKMKELKRRFVKASRRGRDGKTPDDWKIFELSRELWGRGGGGGVPTSPKKGGHAAGPSKLPEGESGEGDWAAVSSQLKLNGIELDEEVLRVGSRMVDRSEVEEIKERFREFQMAELRMAADRATLKLDVTKLFLDGYLAARNSCDG